MNCTNTFILSGNLGKRVVLGNTEYMVYPIVMLVSGVHEGAIGGPVYYPTEVLESSVSHWNNVPLCINHPMDGNGEYVLVNGHGEMISQWAIGIIRNAAVVEGKLKGEGWIDIRRANAIDPSILTNLNNGMQMEVSTGLMAEQEMSAGIWFGESYEGVITEIYPDHLALLPGQEGACNWNDGCGVRVNSKKEGKKEERIFVNKIDSLKIIDKIYEHVNSLDTIMEDGSRGTYNYLRAVYEDSFVYKQVSPDGVEKYYKAEYTVNNDNNQIEYGTRTEVIEKVDYLPLTKKKGAKIMAIKKCCPEKVMTLISNESSPYDESDKDWLENLSEEQLDKVINNIKVETKEIEIEADSLNLEEVIQFANPEVKEQINAGLGELKVKRDGFIQTILANEKNSFEQEDLEKMSMKTLCSIAALSVDPVKEQETNVTYKGNSTPTPQEEEIEPYVMPSLGQQNKE